MAKKLIFYMLYISFLIMFIEFSIRFLWGTIKKNEIEIYKEAMQTAISFQYSDFGVVTPLPNKEIVLFKEEFTDRFKTKRIIDNHDAGFFDNGLDFKREFRAIAIGDSFTRGVGSLDNLKNGWVSRLENEIDWLDLVNFGNSGTGLPQQRVFYDAISKYIEHDGVIVNFYSGNDYVDNAENFDWNLDLNYITDLKQRSGTFVNIQKALLDSGKNFQLTCNFKSRILCIFAGILIKIDPSTDEYFSDKSHWLEVYDSLRENSKSHEKEIPEYISRIATSGRQNCQEYSESLDLPFKWWICSYLSSEQNANHLATHSAKLVNEFYFNLKKKKIKVLFIYHPTMFEIYANENQFRKELSFYRSAKNKLFNQLDKEIKVLDLTNEMYRNRSRGRLYWFKDDHYSPFGYEVASLAISEFLMKNWR